MSQRIDLSPAAPAVSDAASSEHKTRDKWSRAGKALAKCNLTSVMLVKPTEAKPNDAFDQDAYDQVWTFIVQGVSADKKAIAFDTVVPGSISAESPKGSNRWSVADLLALTRDQLRDIDDDMLKKMRRDYMQLVDGTMMSRIRMYVDRANGVETKREAKGKGKAETKTEVSDPIVIIQGWINQATKMVDVTDVDRFQNAGLEMIALLRKMRK